MKKVEVIIRPEKLDDMKEILDECSTTGAMVSNYNYLPDDHYAKIGISFQKYLGDQIDRAGFADEVTAYWATAEVGAH